MTSPLGFKARVGSALFAIFAEANVMCIPQDSPRVLHLLTSWRPARSRSLPHMHVQRCDDKHIMGECAGGGVGAGEAAQVFFCFRTL